MYAADPRAGGVANVRSECFLRSQSNVTPPALRSTRTSSFFRSPPSVSVPPFLSAFHFVTAGYRRERLERHTGHNDLGTLTKKEMRTRTDTAAANGNGHNIQWAR